MTVERRYWTRPRARSAARLRRSFWTAKRGREARRSGRRPSACAGPLNHPHRRQEHVDEPGKRDQEESDDGRHGYVFRRSRCLRVRRPGRRSRPGGGAGRSGPRDWARASGTDRQPHRQQRGADSECRDGEGGQRELLVSRVCLRTAAEAALLEFSPCFEQLSALLQRHKKANRIRAAHQAGAWSERVAELEEDRAEQDDEHRREDQEDQREEHLHRRLLRRSSAVARRRLRISTPGSA